MPELTNRQIRVIVVAPDAPDRLGRYLSTHGMTFQAVSDQKLLQVLGQEVNWIKMGRMPALIAVARDGHIVHQHRGRSMSDLPDFRAVVRKLEGPQPLH